MTLYPMYLDFKPSKQDWLGDIPAHWKMVALHYVGRLKSGESITALQFNEDGEYPVFGGNGFRGNYDRFTHDGDYVLIGRQGALCGNINIATGKFFASEHAIVVNPDWAFDTNWMGYQLLSMNLNQYSVSAAQPGLSAEVIGRLKIAFPPLDEQQAIARFLDFKTAQIDALIAKKKTLLEKLAEKRTALINHAVTKGLDPSVPMKDSGVEWLGEIPGHWQALPLRRLIRTVKTGSTPPSVNEFHFADEGTPWFRPGDFSDQVFLDLAEKHLSEEGLAEVHLFPANTVMHVGIGATIGKVGVITESASCNQQINAIICNENLNHLFAVYFLQSIRDFIVRCGKYTTLPIINQDETKALFFAVPPMGEQIQISNFLFRKEKTIIEQQRKISEVIDRLREYRSALITNAVTGKIDVRDFPIPQLPTPSKETAHA